MRTDGAGEMVKLNFLQGGENLPLSFASLKELRSIYRFLRLLQAELLTYNPSIQFSFDFALDNHHREYEFPKTFTEFEHILRDQGRYARALNICHEEDGSGEMWHCSFDLVKNCVQIQAPLQLQGKIETIWRIARESYGFDT